MSALIDWIPEKVAANMLGKDRTWLQGQRRRRPTRPIPPWYRIGRQIFYKRSDIEAFIESCRGR